MSWGGMHGIAQWPSLGCSLIELGGCQGKLDGVSGIEDDIWVGQGAFSKIGG